jgi:hypothetical protein
MPEGHIRGTRNKLLPAHRAVTIPLTLILAAAAQKRIQGPSMGALNSNCGILRPHRGKRVSRFRGTTPAPFPVTRIAP